MMTLIHITIALLSLGYNFVLLMKPTLPLKTSYGLVAGTLASGVAIMYVNPATMKHVCVSGVTFLVISLMMIAVAKYRKAKYFTV